MAQSTSRLRYSHRSRTTLFGREDDLTVLRRALHDALGGRGSLVLVSGEAGIGKTALMRAFADEADTAGATVLAGACYDLMITPPYRPWFDLMSGIAADGSSPLTGSDQHPQDQPALSLDRLYAETFDVLAGAAAKGPVVGLLDDVHWADAASLNFLRYAARQLDGLPLLLVVTYRDTELDREHPLRQLLPALVRESQATQVRLQSLTTTDVRALVHQRYELLNADEVRLSRYLQERAQGNPLFIGEMLRTLEETGSIARSDKRWEVRSLSSVPIPPLVQQVIEGRLTRLDESSRHLLAMASVIGQDISLNIWRTVSGASEDELSRAIRLAIACDLVEEGRGAAPLRFTHGLVRETLYFEIDLPQRRAWHRVVGDLLATRPSPDPDVVAFHYREAGDDKTVAWSMAAGERAQQLYAWRTAAERFESVLPRLEPDVRGWLHYRTGLLLIYADPARGIDHLSEAERIARDSGDEHLAAYARADRGLLRCLVSDVRRGLPEMTAGVSSLDTLPPLDLPAVRPDDTGVETWMSLAAIQRGALNLVGSVPGMNIRRGALIFWQAWSGRYADVISGGESFVRQAESITTGIEDALGDALSGLGHAYAALGRPEEALDAFARARTTYQKINHHFKEGNTAIYELSQAYLPYRADRIMERQWLAEQAEAC